MRSGLELMKLMPNNQELMANNQELMPDEVHKTKTGLFFNDCPFC